MLKILKTIQDRFASRLICRAVALLIVWCLPVICVAQSTLILEQPSLMPSTLRWGGNYSLSLIASSDSQPTQATTLTLYLEEGGVSRRIDETPYALADEFLPLQEQIIIPGIAATTSHEARIQGQAGTGLVGTTTLRYCNDKQSVCTPSFEVDWHTDSPSRDINGNYQLSITSSTVVFGECAAVRERTQRIKITQIGSTAVYRFTDDFGQEPMLAAAISADTYIFTAQYDTAPTFPGTSTVIVRVEFADDNTGSGRANWAYESDDGEICEGVYRVGYGRSSEAVKVRTRVFLESPLAADPVPSVDGPPPPPPVSSATFPERVQDAVLSGAGVLYALGEDHTLWSIASSDVGRQLTGAAANSDEVDIHDLVFVEQSISSDTLYIVDAFLRAVIAVDLSDGSRTVVSGCDVINRCPSGHYWVGSGVPLVQPSDAVLDEANGRLILSDAYLSALIAVDLLSGERTVVSGCTAADLCPAGEHNVGGGVALLHPQALDMNSSATRIVVVDDALDALLAVDVATGDRGVVSGCRVRDVCVIEERGLGPSFDKPIAVVLDNDADLAYVADNGLEAVIEVDLEEGDRVELLSPVTVRAPYHLSLDKDGRRILIYDEAGGTVMAVAQSASTSTQLIIFEQNQEIPASAPSPPSGLTAAVRDAAIVLSWRPVARATAYKMYWNTFADLNAGRADQVIDDIYGSSYVHSSLPRGQLYYYAVSAINAEGESDLSEAVSVMLPRFTGDDETAPTLPVIVSIRASSTTAIALDWMASVDDRSAAEQIVYEIHVAESTATVVGDATKRAMVQGIYSVGVGGLQSSRTYYVYVGALDEVGNRSLSKAMAIRTMSQLPRISTQNEIVFVDGILDDQGLLIVDQRGDFKPGQILLGEDRGNTYLRRVSRVEDDGGQIRIYTTDASLSDVYERLDLNFSVKLEDVEDESALAAAKSAAVRDAQQGEQAPANEVRLRQFSPALQVPNLPPAVWPYQPIYEDGRQIREMYWPDSGFKLRQFGAPSSSDGADGVGYGIELRSGQQLQPPPPGNYQSRANGDIRVYYPYQEVFKIDERGDFDIYVERLNPNCTVESPALERLTHQGRSRSASGLAIRAKGSEDQSNITGYRLSWRPSESYADDKPYSMQIIARSSCSALNFSVRVYIPTDFRLVIPLIDKKVVVSSANNEATLESNLKFEFSPEVSVNAELAFFRLKRAHVIVSGKVDLSTILKAVIKRGLDWTSKERELGSKDFSVPIPIGGIVINASGTLRLLWYVRSVVSGEVSITQNFDAAYRLSYGFTYVRGEGFKPINSENSNSEYKITLQTAAGALVEFNIVPQLELGLYNLPPFFDSRLEPKVYGDMGVEGTFSYVRSSDFRESATDARYRFTKLEAGLGLSGGVRAVLRSLGRSILLSWPRDESFYELFDVRYPFFSLPQIHLSDNENNSYTATVAPGRWFSGENTIQNNIWEVIPAEGAPAITSINRNSVRLEATEEIGDREYTLRYTGHSRYGKPIVQYEEIPIALKPIQRVRPRIVSPAEGTTYNLRSDETDDVTVVIEAPNTAAELTLTVSVDNAEVVSVPSASIVVAAVGNAMRRSAQFTLTGKEAGEALVTLVATDNFGNRDETQLRVVVEPIRIASPRIVSPAEGTAYNLKSDETDDVTVVIEVPNTAAELTLTVSVDNAEVVSIPSAPIAVAAVGNAIQRSTQFTLTAKDPGEALVTLVATDNFGNTDETQLRVVVEPIRIASPRIISPAEGTTYNLRSDETDDVTVVIEVPNTAAEITLTVSVDNAEVMSVPSTPIVVAAVGNAIQRSTQFRLTAKESGEALVTLVATDNFGNRDEVQLRVVVEPLQIASPRIVSPADGTTYNLRSDETDDVTVVIEALNTAADITLTVSVDNAEVISVPSTPITVAAAGNAIQRSTQFKLTAKEVGEALVTLVATDNFGNRDETQLRVVVADCSGDCLPEMVVVPAGSFMMGSPEDNDEAFSDEMPQRRVTISSFAIGKYEVTRGQFAAFVDATGYNASSGRYNWRNPWRFNQNDAHPVVDVSWYDVQAYIRWLSAQTGHQYRLLSEAEWEYAARAGTTTSYHFGDTIDATQARFDSSTGTVTVGLYPANKFGLHDMHGNVWEWVEDCWHYDYKGAPTNGSAWVSDCYEDSRVQRGGSWGGYPSHLRSTYRGGDDAKERSTGYGFRVARTLGLRIVSPAGGTMSLLSDKTDDVTVVIEVPNTTAELTLTISVDDAEVVSVPSTSIAIVAAGDAIRRSTQIKLTGKDAGKALVTLVATDNFGNRDEMQLRVVVVAECSASSTKQTNEVFRDCTNCPVMVTLPCGTFLMSSPEDEEGREDGERPQHWVTISSFAVGKYEVTRGQFAAFVDATGYNAIDRNRWRNPRGFEQNDAHPVVNVSWYDAQAYVRWLSAQTGHQYRLLNEAEWEYAARAGTTTSYSFGNTIDATQARFDSSTGTVAVGLYPANAFGLHDMHGNVYEWVEDCFHYNYEGAPTNGSAWVADCDDTSGRGDNVSVLRGGAWYNRPGNGNLRSASRNEDVAWKHGSGRGFRVARTLEPLVAAKCSGDCLPEMVVIPAGSFVMGSPEDEEDRHDDEGPQRRVTISRSFAVGKYEVTRGQFAAFVSATRYNASTDWRNPGFRQNDAHPVVNVSWDDAQAYIRWLSAQTGHQYRLLSEAEWEYAARAGTTTRYHFGDTISSDQANYDHDGNNDGTVAVGSYAANAFGLYDMHGNVWEWVEDCWHGDYEGAPTDGSAWVSDCFYFEEDVRVLFEEDVRVLRGGSWLSLPGGLRSAYRSGDDTRSRNDDGFGFRVARTL